MRKYCVVFEKGPRNFSAYVPDVPGCVAAGRTKAETRRLIKRALRMHIASMRRDGEPIPKSTTRFAVVRV